MFRKKDWPYLLGWICMFGWAVHGVWKGGMMGYGDGVPFPEDAQTAFRSFVSAWDPRSPGIKVPQIPVLSSLIPMEGVLITLCGGNAVVAQRIFHWLALALPFFSIYFVLGRFFKSPLAKFVASFIYAVNPVTVGEMLGGFEGTLYIHALFPLILLLLYDLAQKFSWRKWLSFTVLAAISILFSDHFVIFLLPVVPLFLFFWVRGRPDKVRRLGSGLGLFGGAAVLALLLVAFHSWGYLQSALPFLSGEGVPRATLAFLRRNVDDTYRYWTMGDILRLGGSRYLGLYNPSQWWARSGFIIPVLVYGWLLLVPRLNRKRMRLAFGAVFLAFLPIFFITRNSHEKLYWLFDTLPFLYRFRNPVRPLLFLVTCFAPMIALTVEGWLRVLGEIWGEQGKRLATVTLGVALLPLVYYNQPFFSGDLTMGKNRGIGYRIPAVHYEIGAWLEERRVEEGTFRTLWLPWTHEGTEAKLYWVDPYAYAVPINYGAYVQNDYLEFMKSTYRALATEGADAVNDLAQAGVRYVLLDINSQEQGKARFEYGYQTPWLLGTAGDWERILQNYEELTPVEGFDGYKVFENQDFDWGKVDPELSGLESENIGDMAAQRRVLLMVSLITWVVVGVWWISPKVSFRARPRKGNAVG